MKKFLELISEEMGKGFEAAGYEAQLGRVTVSNRPDPVSYTHLVRQWSWMRSVRSARSII